MTILAYKTNNVSKAPRDHLTKILDELVRYKRTNSGNFKRAGSVNGYDFYYCRFTDYDPPHYFTCFKGDTCVAYMGLVQIKPSAKPDYVLVSSKMKGQGIGYAMYNAAIAYFGVLDSDYSLSAGATQLWRKLSTKHRVDLMVAKKSVKIVGWIESTETMWSPSGGVYAYPVVKQKDGSTISLLDLYNRSKTTRYGTEINAIRSCYFRAYK